MTALERYRNGEKPFISTHIDDDTIIMGYGEIHSYDFEFPLPPEIIKEIHGTTSWNQLFINKGYYHYNCKNNETGEVTPLGLRQTDEEIKNLQELNPNFTFTKIV